MQKFYEVAGEVMGFFDAFKGSRPAINNEKILIVRGRSRKTLDVNDFNSKLDEIGSIIKGKKKYYLFTPIPKAQKKHRNPRNSRNQRK